MFDRVLIVCVGNICRSPMAEAILRRALADRGKRVTVESAGVGALAGHPADPIAQELMRERALDLTAHRARQLTPAMATSFDLVLTMEEAHVRAVETLSPSARGRVFRLGKWSNFDVPDPYRKPREAFEDALRLIDQGLEDWQKKAWGA